MVERTKPRVWRVSYRHEGGAGGWTRIALRQRHGDTLLQLNMYDAGD